MQSFWYVLPGSLFWPDVSPFSFCITRPATDFPKERTTCDTAARKIHVKILLKYLAYMLTFPDLIGRNQRLRNGSKRCFLSLLWPFPYSAFFAFTSTCWYVCGKGQPPRMDPDPWGIKIMLARAKRTKFVWLEWWSLSSLYLPFAGFHYR